MENWFEWMKAEGYYDDMPEKIEQVGKNLNEAQKAYKKALDDFVAKVADAHGPVSALEFMRLFATLAQRSTQEAFFALQYALEGSDRLSARISELEAKVARLETQ